MNFYDYITNELKQRGLFDNQVSEVMENVIASNEEMKGRWFEKTINYPPMLKNIIWLSVEDIALSYIKENCPEAWFRPLFDKEHPLRKQFEMTVSL